MELQSALHLFADEFSADLVNRQAEALARVARANADGFAVAHLPAVRDVLTIGLKQVEESGDVFVGPVVSLLNAIAQPYKPAKAGEERLPGAVGALRTLFRAVADATFTAHGAVGLAAARALLRLTTLDGEGTAGAWEFHQALLRDSGAAEAAVLALHHHLTSWLSAMHTRSDSPPGGDAASPPGGGGSSARGGSSATGRGPSALTATAAALATQRSVTQRAPDMIVLLLRALTAMTESGETCGVIVKAGVLSLCMAVLDGVDNTRDPAIPLAVEMVWNACEHSVAASRRAVQAEPPASLAGLAAVLRERNALAVLSTAADMGTLTQLLLRLVRAGATTSDRELRNDVVVVASLLARRSENIPVLAASGFVDALLQLTTAAEQRDTGGIVSAPLGNYASTADVDYELKLLGWGLVMHLASDPTAFLAAAGDGLPSCRDCVVSSGLLHTLVGYLDPETARSHPYISLWTPAQLRALQMASLHLLQVLAPIAGDAVWHPAVGVLRTLHRFLAAHAPLAGPGGPDAGLGEGMREVDAARTLAALRLLSALTLPPPPLSASLPALIATHPAAHGGRGAATLPTLAASKQVVAGKGDEVAFLQAGGVVLPAGAQPPVTVVAAGEAGEMGLVQLLASILLAVPLSPPLTPQHAAAPSGGGGGQPLQGSSLTDTAFAAAGGWMGGGGGVEGGDGGGGAARSASAASLHSVTPASATAAGRTVVMPTQLLEGVLMCLAAVAWTCVVQTAGGEGRDALFDAATSSPAPLSEDMLWALANWEAALKPLPRMDANQARLREAGVLPALVQVLRFCAEEGRRGGTAEGSASATAARVALAAVAATRAALAGCRDNIVVFVAGGGMDALLDVTEVAPLALKPACLAAVAEVVGEPHAAVVTAAWRSDLTGETLRAVLLRCWISEEARLGVARDPITGALPLAASAAVLLHPLDAPAATATAAATAPVPTSDDVATAGSLRDALALASVPAAPSTLRWTSDLDRAANPLAAAAQQVDLRPGLHAALAALGNPTSAEPPLPPKLAVAAELAHAAPGLYHATAWRAAARVLDALAVPLVPDDEAALLGSLGGLAQQVEAVAAAQVAPAAALASELEAAERSLITSMVLPRQELPGAVPGASASLPSATTALAAAGLAAPTVASHRSGKATPTLSIPSTATGGLAGGAVSGGGGLTMEERKAIASAKSAMLARSFQGYRPVGGDGTLVAPAAAASVGGR